MPEDAPAPGTRERIVDAATELFAERGYLGTSMREIAEELGVSKPALYHHFADKQALLLAVLLAAIEEAGAIVERAASRRGGVRDKVRTLLEGIIRDRRRQRSAMRLAEREAVHLADETRARMLAMYRQEFLLPVETLLKSGQDAGELTASADTAWLAHALLALAQPLLSVDASNAEQQVNATLDLFFEGAGRR